MDGTLVNGDALAWLLTLASNPVALGLFVFGLVATVKRSVDGKYELEVAAGRSPRPVRARTWRALAFGVGLVTSLALHAGTGRATFGGGWLGVVAFGLVAGLISIVGRDGLKTMFSWFGLAAATLPPVVGGVAVSGGAPGPSLPTPVPVGPLPPGPGALEELRPASTEDLARLADVEVPIPGLDRI